MDGLGTYSPFDEKPSDDVIANAAQLAEQRLPVQGKVVEYLIDRIRDLETHSKDLFEANINLQMQARIQACEAETQRGTVHEIYQICTGGTGEPGNWNGAKPVAVALKKERDKALEEAAQIMDAGEEKFQEALERSILSDAIFRNGACADQYQQSAAAIRALKDKGG